MFTIMSGSFGITKKLRLDMLRRSSEKTESKRRDRWFIKTSSSIERCQCNGADPNDFLVLEVDHCHAPPFSLPKIFKIVLRDCAFCTTPECLDRLDLPYLAPERITKKLRVICTALPCSTNVCLESFFGRYHLGVPMLKVDFLPCWKRI